MNVKQVMFIILIAISCCSQSVRSQGIVPIDYTLIYGTSASQSKNFYLLTLMEELQEVSQELHTNKTLSQLSRSKRQDLVATLDSCKQDVACYTDAVKFTPDEIERVATELRTMLVNAPALNRLVQQHLMPSGRYQRYQSPDLGDMLAKSWIQDARAVNHTIEVYAQGKKPNYPHIDSVNADKKWYRFVSYIEALNEVVSAETEGNAEHTLFFQIPLLYAMRALEMSGMEHLAGQFEPMEKGVNKLAYKQINHTNFNHYKYSLILVPGWSPGNVRDSISPVEILNCHLAAEAYRRKVAPFIIVSGGNVNPYKTQYNEALEMKKRLVNIGVPAEAILVDPHARHTTTNIRNTARIMFRYGFPTDKPAAIISSPDQSRYIFSEELKKRCLDELGFMPYRTGQRISSTMIEFYPEIAALSIDDDEPLDP